MGSHVFLPFGESLKTRLAAVSGNQRKLAKAIERNQGTVSRWLRRTTAPADFDGLSAASDYLGVDFDDLRLGIVPIRLLSASQLERVRRGDVKLAGIPESGQEPPPTPQAQQQAEQTGPLTPSQVDPRVMAGCLALRRIGEISPDLLDMLVPMINGVLEKAEADSEARKFDEEVRRFESPVPGKIMMRLMGLDGVRGDD